MTDAFIQAIQGAGIPVSLASAFIASIESNDKDKESKDDD